MLEESVQRIVKVLSGNVEKISLFGSYARGRSDLFTDLLKKILAEEMVLYEKGSD